MWQAKSVAESGADVSETLCAPGGLAVMVGLDGFQSSCMDIPCVGLRRGELPQRAPHCMKSSHTVVQNGTLTHVVCLVFRTLSHHCKKKNPSFLKHVANFSHFLCCAVSKSVWLDVDVLETAFRLSTRWAGQRSRRWRGSEYNLLILILIKCCKFILE